MSARRYHKPLRGRWYLWDKAEARKQSEVKFTPAEMTIPQFKRMLSAQYGAQQCAICGTEEKLNDGGQCHRCSVAIGLLKSSRARTIGVVLHLVNNGILKQ
jgi:hypothetical protein